MEYPDLKRAVIAQIQSFRPRIVLIEDKASGIQLIQELRAMGHSIIKEYKPVGDKVMRAMAQTPAFEGGFVRLPRQAPWLDAYVLELTTFPRGKFDDQVDSTSQALGWLAVNCVEPGIITYYRMLAQQQNSGLH
jgi:predicted phage terminase large subunit-like protein